MTFPLTTDSESNMAFLHFQQYTLNVYVPSAVSVMFEIEN